MDFETVDAAAFGRSMKGIGLNILIRDVRQEAAFLTPVFDMAAHRLSANTGCNGKPQRPQSAPSPRM